jgi:hypothetical protein
MSVGLKVEALVGIGRGEAASARLLGGTVHAKQMRDDHEHDL